MQLNPEHFHLPCKKPHNRSQSPFTPVPSHWQSPKSTVCMQNVCILGISFKWTHTVCGLLCLAQFLKRRNIYACLPYVIYSLLSFQFKSLLIFLTGLLSYAQVLGLFLHSVYKPLYVFCRYFFPTCGLLFIFSKMSFAKHTFLIFRKTNLTIISFMCHAFSVVSKNL